MNMNEQQLPPGWESASLFDICSPKQWPTLATSELSSNGYPVYGANGKIGFHTAYNHEHPTILITCRGATCGTLNVCEAKSWVNGNAMALDDLQTDAADFSYTLFALRNRGFSDVVSGSAQPQITRAGLEPVQIPLAPLPEQRRIVAKIEALQERSGRAAKALEEVGPLLEQFRQSILAAAFSGRLTADWREKNPNVEPAHELLARIRTERRQRWEQAELAKYEAKGKQPPKDWKDKYEEPEAVDQTDLPELPDGWCWASIGELSEIVEYGSSAKTTDDSSSVPVLRMGNILDGELKLDDLRYLPIEHSEFPQLLLHVGDLLFNRTNSAELVGKTAVFKGTPFPCSFASYLIRLRVVLTDPELVAFYINSPFGRAWAKTQVSQQVGQANINGTKLKHLAIPIPPAEEQTELLRRLVAALNHARDISGKASDTASSIMQLNQSILAKAFRGELVSQDPNDEPASELLARIRREKEVSGDRAQGAGRKKKAGGKGNASESARPAKRSKRSSKAASSTTSDASADTSPEPARPQRRRRRSSSSNEDASLVIRVLAEGGGVNIHADTSGPTVQFYTKSSGGGLLAEIEDIPEAYLKPRESKRVANLSDLMEPDLALLYPNDVNETYLPQLRDWYTWAAPQLPEHFESEFLEQAKSRWSEALQIEEPSTSQSATKAKRGRLFDA